MYLSLYIYVYTYMYNSNTQKDRTQTETTRICIPKNMFTRIYPNIYSQEIMPKKRCQVANHSVDREDASREKDELDREDEE